MYSRFANKFAINLLDDFFPLHMNSFQLLVCIVCIIKLCGCFFKSEFQDSVGSDSLRCCWDRKPSSALKNPKSLSILL